MLTWQVVVGVLGCPNLPQKRIEDEDGAGESASKAGTDGVGVIFAAERGQGAFAGPLSGVLNQAAVFHEISLVDRPLASARSGILLVFQVSSSV